MSESSLPRVRSGGSLLQKLSSPSSWKFRDGKSSEDGRLSPPQQRPEGASQLMVGV